MAESTGRSAGVTNEWNHSICLTADMCRPEQKPAVADGGEIWDTGDWSSDVQRQRSRGMTATEGAVYPGGSQQAPIKSPAGSTGNFQSTELL